MVVNQRLFQTLLNMKRMKQMLTYTDFVIVLRLKAF
jgi:hypothetical protein